MTQFQVLEIPFGERAGVGNPIISTNGSVIIVNYVILCHINF